jgi:peptidoglycan LD-endopeptidase LytH
MNNGDVVIDVLQKNVSLFYKVVPFDASRDKLLLLDFTEANKDLKSDTLINTDRFTEYVHSKLIAAKATYGIGGYAEHRTIYSRSSVFDDKEEPRRLHLGIDIWGKPHTKVMVPLEGLIHSYAFNSAYGDYGATIILSHHLDGVSFHTLYGHLSLASIKNMREGERVKGGDVIAEFGIPQENGNWPPHLHFQIIKDLEGRKGDYPGVCKFSEKEKYLKNCPDPDLILGMMQYAR